jgi:hypothetical protein
MASFSAVDQLRRRSEPPLLDGIPGTIRTARMNVHWQISSCGLPQARKMLKIHHLPDFPSFPW